MATITPLHDRVLIKRTEKEEKTASGIIIPVTAQEKTHWGTVLAIGTGRIDANGILHPLSVKKGDLIVFGKYTGTEFKFQDEEYLILREDDILGIVQQ
ncbi:MAG: chaperonin GroES [Candidatus Dependentiae bacterium]|nr:chaperonin GroES [Candidatus Dependentiae bacterium]